jgi:predicted nucleic acid-binding protein
VSGAVFLDTGIFVAILNGRDQRHEQAVTLFTQDRPKWFCSYLVVSEAYSWFLHRMGEEPARTFRLFLGNLDGLRVLEATKHHHLRVLAMLDRFRGAKLTYVDASSLCFMEQNKIRRVWSTDHHLGLTGAEVTPRS